MRNKIAIIGAGIIGLQTARVLMQQHHQVVIYADTLSPNTTSDVSAAIWMPYAVAPEDKAMAWGDKSLAYFHALIEQSASWATPLGEELLCTEYYTEHPPQEAWRKLITVETPAEYQRPGLQAITSRVPVIQMQHYMPYLQQQVQALGAEIKQQRIEAFSELGKHHDIIINCAGMGVKTLSADEKLQARRGQVVLLQRPASLKDSFAHPKHQDGLTYIVPRGDQVVVGGTDEASDNPEVDLGTADAILKRATELVPELAEAKILGHKVGFRPSRDTVRVELEQCDELTIIHNYGHGGGGVTLSVGCAEEVANILQQYLQNKPRQAGFQYAGEEDVPIPPPPSPT